MDGEGVGGGKDMLVGRVWGSVRHVGCSGSVGMCDWEGIGGV